MGVFERGASPSFSFGGVGGEYITPIYAIINVSMREFIRITAFVLIIVGTLGLLLNEFAWEQSSSRTIIFAVVDFVGLVNLAFAHYGMREKTEA